MSDDRIRKKNRPGWHREVVGYRLVPMRSEHVDIITVTEAAAKKDAGHRNPYPPKGGSRCPWCFGHLDAARASHFCRWKSARFVPVALSDLKMRQVPVYRWFPPNEGPHAEGGGDV